MRTERFPSGITRILVSILIVLLFVRCGGDRSTGLEETPRCEMPIFSPPPGTSSEPQSVTMTSTTPGATIHYTLDGSEPTGGSTVHVGPIRIARTTTIRAIAFAPGFRPSLVATGTYRIEPCSIAVAAPNGGESWFEGETREIGWASSDCGGWVRIGLYHSGTLCESIADSTENDGSFSWAVSRCGSVESDYRIRIEEFGSGAADESDGPFSIHAADSCRLSVTSPNGGEIWDEGSVQEIAWTLSEACGDSVRIELVCEETVCSTIADRTGNDGSFEWTVELGAAVRTVEYRIRITDLETGRSDGSDGPFTVLTDGVCALRITSPEGNQIWTEGARKVIRWYAEGSCGEAVRVELLLDDLSCLVLGESLPNTGLFEWTVGRCGDPIGPYRIRVTDLQSGVHDVSNGSLTVLSCRPTVTSPNGAERWTEGTIHEVRWSQNEMVCLEPVLIELVRDGAACRTIADSTANSGSFGWLAERCDSYTEGYKVWITGLYSGAWDESDGTFSIFPAEVCHPAVVSPNGGQAWQIGSIEEITWTSTGPCGGLVRIELVLDGDVCRMIGTEAENTGSYLWRVDACGEVRDGYGVRVTDIEWDRSDMSDGTFSIVPVPCQLTLIAPNGDESWQEGTEHWIRWESSAACGDSVRLDLFVDGAVCAQVAESTENDGVYVWETFPCNGEVGGFRVRVADIESGAFDESDGIFSIPPVVPCQEVVVSPNGGERWIEGGTQDITWIPSPCDTDVRIELLLAGEVCSTVATETPDDGAYGWVVQGCGADTSRYKIRIVGVTGGASDESDAPFSIPKPPPPCRLTLLTPGGGEIWQEGSEREILWESADCGGSVAIELLRDGAVCSTIAEATENDGAFIWTARNCDDEETGYAIRIIDPEGPTTGESGLFSIPECSLAVTSPSGGEVWPEGSEQTLTWEASDACGGLVRIELLRDGSPCLTIAAETENDGSFSWTAENCGNIETGYTVRVTDIESGGADASNGVFTLEECRITLIAPNGGEGWQEGSEQQIEWISTEACGAEVRIELICGGAVCSTIAEAAANDGSFTWVAALCCDSPCDHRIRVTDISTERIDESDGSFCICPPCARTLLSPNGGEVWREGTEHEITWSSQNCTGPIRIELIHDGTVCLTIAESAPDNGSFSWVAQNCAAVTEGYRIRISDGCGISDESDGVLSIPECVLTVTSPNGGERWEPGSLRTITWTSDTCGGDVRIELLLYGSVCSTIATATPNDGSYDWSAVPCSGIGCGYSIRITDLESGKYDAGNSPFCICPPCQAVVTSPNGGESWVEGEEYEIAWDPAIACDGTVKIELLRAGSVCRILASETPNDGTYLWSAERCNLNTPGYRIRVTGRTCQQADESDGTFEILPPPCRIDVAVPDGGESWPAGSTREITWNSSGGCGSVVRIDLLLSGEVCATINEGTPHDGTFLWPVARCGESTDGYSVRITDLVTGAVGESEGTFAIPVCDLTLLTPNGGESWEEGSIHEIAWESADCGGSIRIELLRDGVACALVAAETPNDGLFEWTAGNCGEVETGYAIRITDLDTGTSDASDGIFEIPEPPCQLTVTSPNGGEDWEVGSQRIVAWSEAGGCGELVRIELLRDGAVCSLLAGSAPNSGTYAWHVDRCDEVPTGYTIRITDLDSGSSDESDGSFDIPCGPCVPTVFAPDGGEIWQETETSAITWEAHPCDAAVRIELVRDGVVCATIADSTPNGGSFSWMAWSCDVAETGYRIRITGLECLQTDESDAPFSIVPIADLYYFAPDLRFCAGEQNLQVFVYGRNSRAIKGYGISLCFDPAVFECVGIDLGGTRGEGAGYFEESCADGCARAGVIYAASCPPEIPVGDGTLLKLTLNVKPDAPVGTTYLDLENMGPSYNTMAACDGAPVDPILLDSSVEICSAATQGGGGQGAR